MMRVYFVFIVVFMSVLGASGQGFQEAQFQGGELEMFKYLNENLKLESRPFKNLRIKARIFVDSEGNVEDCELVNSISYSDDEKIIEAFFQMPQWNPASRNGVPEASSTLVEFLIPKTHKIFTATEVMPEFVGGTSALYKYIGENMNMKHSKDVSVQEFRVFFKVIIDEEGKVCCPVFLKTGYANKALIEDIEIFLEEMPNWKPGEQDGFKVKVYFTFPIVFNRGPRKTY